MCLVLVVQGVSLEFPLIVAANRDEYHDRPSTPPVRFGPNIVAPKDLARGGTWIGATREGFFAAVTNQDDSDRRETAYSRGQVVLGALERGRTAGMWEVIRNLDPHDYNPFNLVAGDASGVKLYTLSGRGAEVRPLPSGIHAISNDCHGVLYEGKVRRAEEWGALIDPLEFRHEVVLRHMAAMLQDHASERPDNPHMGICVHDGDFGTRSSTVILVNAVGVPRMWHAEGQGCLSYRHFEEFSDLFDPEER